MKNADLRRALDAMEALCGPRNRLPVLAAVEADRILRALRAAYQPIEAARVRLVEQHGEPWEGGHRVTERGWAAFAAAYTELMAGETDVTVRPLRLQDVALGYSLDADGKHAPLDITPTQLGVLIELGCVTEG